MEAVDDDPEGAWVEEAEVMSEVHVGAGLGTTSTVSVFSIAPPAGQTSREWNTLNHGNDSSGHRLPVNNEEDGHSEARHDEHGDLVIPRRRKHRWSEEAPADAVVIHHLLKTQLPQVGLQVWRGALLLSDYILHMQRTSIAFNDVIALELGAGTGLAGLIMARVSPLVYITDKGADILDNCYRNVIQNSMSLSKGERTVRVRELDWQKPWPPDVSEDQFGYADKSGSYQWTHEDIVNIGRVSVILAADVVYSENLTSALFNMLRKLMPLSSDKVLFLAIEKRYNFSTTELDVVAHGYWHFRTFLKSEPSLAQATGRSSKEDGRDIASTDFQSSEQHFVGRRIDINGIQRSINYDRGNDMELWEVRARSGAETARK